MKNLIHNKKFQVALGFLVGTTLIACNVKTVPRTQHEDQVETSQKQELSTQSDVQTLDSQKLDLNSMHKTLINPKATEVELSAITEQLKPYFINSKFLLSATNIENDRSKVMLAYFNETLLKLLELKSEKAKNLLKDYVTSIKFGCNSELKGCQFLSFYKLDYRTSKVLLEVLNSQDAQIETCKENCDSIVLEYYNNVFIALELKNMIKDSNLDFMYLKHARAYANILLKMPASENVKNLTTRHASVFENIFSTFPLDSKNENLKTFVKNFNPWGYSKLDGDLFPYGTKRMFTYAASNFVYVDSKLNPEFKNSILTSQKIEDKTGKSFKQIGNDILAENSKNLKNLGVDSSLINSDEFYDEYFYIIDRLYKGHISIEEAALIWQGSKKETSKLLQKIDYYTKINILRMLGVTNNYIGDMYANRTGDNKNLFQKTLEKSKNLSDTWLQMFNQLDSISIFIGAHVQNHYVANDEVESTKQMISSLKRNIKYLSVYPNMMLLAYFVTKIDGSVPVDTWFGSFEIKPESIVKSLMDGDSEPPWFRFGNDENPINRYENIFSLYYALNTGLFEVYSNKKDSLGNSIADRLKFFDKMILQYITSNVNDLKLALSNFKQKISETGDFNNFLSACRKIENKSNLTVSLDLEKLDTIAYLGLGNAGLSEAGQKIYSSYSSPDSVLKSLRETRNGDLGFEKKFVFVKTMAQLIKNNIANLDLKDKDIMIREIDTSIQSIENVRNQYYTQALQVHNLTSSCLNQMYKMEIEKQNSLIDLELKNASDIYDSMVVVLNEDKKFSKIINNSQFGIRKDLEDVNEAGYTFNKLNLLLRMKDRLESTQSAVINVPPELNRLTIYNQKTLIPIRDEKGNIIPKAEFMKLFGLKINGNSDAFLNWYSPLNAPEDSSKLISSLVDKLRAMQTLYVFGKQYASDNANNIKVEDLIETLILIKNQIHITDEDSKRLTALGINRKASKKDITNILLHEVRNEKIPILDFIYKGLSDNQDQIDEPLNLYKSLTNLGTFLFQPSKEVEQELKKLFTPFATVSVNYVKEFEGKVKEIQQKMTNSSELNIRYTLDEMYTPSLDKNNAPILVSPDKIEDFNARMKVFNENTHNFFVDEVSKKKMKTGSILLILILISQLALAISKESSPVLTEPQYFNTQNIKDFQAIIKLLKSEFNSSPWSFHFNFETRTNILKENDQQNLSNKFLGGVSYSLTQQTAVDVEFSTSFTSKGFEMNESDMEGREFEIYVGVSNQKDLFNNLSLASAIGYSLPISQENSYQQSKGSLAAESGLSYSFFAGRYVILNKLSGIYIINTFDKSPSSLKYNIDSSFEYSLVNVFKITNWMKFSFGAMTRSSHFIDNSNQISMAGFAGPGLSYKNFSLNLAYINSNYFDNEKIGPLLFDEYRQNFKLSLGADF